MHELSLSHGECMRVKCHTYMHALMLTTMNFLFLKFFCGLQMEHEEAHRVGSSSSGGGSSSSRGVVRSHGAVGQWRPALQSIAEVGT